MAVSMAIALFAGCASVGPTEMLSSRSETAQPQGPFESIQLSDAVTIDAIEIAQTNDAARIDILTSEALVWTTYRDESGQLVVELPNSQPGPAVGDLESGSGLVRRVRVSRESAGSRMLTRLLIETRNEAEHSVSAAEGGLKVEFGSIEQLAAIDEAAPLYEDAPSETTTVAAVQAPAEVTVWESEPVARSESEPVMVETVARSRVETAATAVTASGRPATQLRDIDVVRIDDSIIVRILGDGEFSYATLSLEAPYRYVVDLAGVANFAPRSVYSFGGEPVKQVRVAQFKSRPDPVSRVVVDLAYPSTPELVGLPDGLALSFGGAAAASWNETSTLVDDVAASDSLATIEVAAPTEQVYEDVPAVYEAPAGEPEGDEYADAGLSPRQEPIVEPPALIMEKPAPVVEAPAPMVESPTSVMADPAPSVAEVTSPPAAAASPPPVNIQLAQPEPGGRAASELFNSQVMPLTNEKIYRGEPITLHLKDADIRDLLRSFSEISGLNFVIQPGVSGTVTVELTDVPWDQALDLILKTNDLGYQLEGNILRIAPLAKLRDEAEAEQRLRQAQAQAVPLTTIIKRVSYAGAQEVAQVLQSGSNSILSRRGSVVVDTRTNTLIIKELPNFIDTVIAIIETLDIPEPQVMIEARIIETTKRFSRTLGINWGFGGISSAATGNTTGLVFPNQGTIDGAVNLTQAGSGTLGITLGNVLNTFQLDIALQAAESEGLINILSAPRITTLNNKPASIQSGLQIPIQTVSNNTVSVQFVNATLKLDVTPHVTAEGTVMMEISIQKREPLLAFAVVGAANAPISTKDASTSVIVRDGGTTVIGGIYEVSSDEGQDRVPGLSRIPFLKHLFKNNRQSEENEELLIFITPRIVNL
ncbi:MAG: type IV pilus secretin PilQ [Acidobacteria bacterium]|nr:type IV pilus secretin PilQ [Acidobacteriota bacterium]